MAERHKCSELETMLMRNNGNSRKGASSPVGYKWKQYTARDSTECSSKESDEEIDEMSKADIAYEMNGKRNHNRTGRRDTLVRAESKEDSAFAYDEEI